MDKEIINKKITLISKGFWEMLDQSDEAFLSRIANLDEKNISNVLKFKKWDWFQGVGLFGYWRSYQITGDRSYFELVKAYYDSCMQQGLPDKNINSVCPMLTLAYLYEETGEEVYLEPIREWASWVKEELPRTQEGGFQHITSESSNEGQLWDDTLFMTVLFLAKAGKLLGKEDYIEEALYQFMVHIKYLTDRETGLWYHGWTFKEGHNYAKALWARGNCWITISIPEFIEITGLKEGAAKRFLVEALKRQVEALAHYQDETGLWHTIVNEEDSYVEASGSAGFAYGILRAVSLGLIEESYLEIALKPCEALMALIDEEGKVNQVSIGTPMGETIAFYKGIGIAPMAYGQALVLFYLLEAMKYDTCF